MSLALFLMVIIVIVLGQVSISTTNSMDYLVHDTTADQQMKRVLNKLVSELRLSSENAVVISTSDPDHDLLTLQTTGTFNGTVDWGIEDQQGVWKSGWAAQYQVVGNDLARRILNTSGNPVGGDEVIVLAVDNFNGTNKGFEIVQSGPVINVTIRVNIINRDNKSFVKQVNSSVYMKNS